MLIFTKPSILALKWESMKNIKKKEKIVSKSICFLKWIFLGFWNQLGWILAPKLRPQTFYPPRQFFKLRPGGGQEAPKRLPRAPQERPRASQEHPRASQERPRATKTCPGDAQGGSRGVPFCAFLRFFSFFPVFCVLEAFLHFLCFFELFCVFVCFHVFCFILRISTLFFSGLS